MADAPGFAMPIEVTDPRRGTLASAHWEMEFVALNPTSTAASAPAPQDGAPGDVGTDLPLHGPAHERLLPAGTRLGPVFESEARFRPAAVVVSV